MERKMKFEEWVTPDMIIYRTSDEIEYMKQAWDASRDNQQEYQKYEFCRDMECDNLYNQASCVVDDPAGCPLTAKEFHCWLKENGYRIVKDR
jgi:hypothetical protein